MHAFASPIRGCGMPPRKISKKCLPEIDVQMWKQYVTENYEVVKLMVGG